MVREQFEGNTTAKLYVRVVQLLDRRLTDVGLVDKSARFVAINGMTTATVALPCGLKGRALAGVARTRRLDAGTTELLQEANQAVVIPAGAYAVPSEQLVSCRDMKPNR